VNNTIRRNPVISAVLSVLLALALVLSPVTTMSTAYSYAATDEVSSGVDEATETNDAGQYKEQSVEDDADTDENAPDNSKAVTHISNCATSYSKLIGEALDITADIDPAEGREVQLQRYDSNEKSWSVIMTESAEENAEEEEESSGEEASAHVSFSVPEEERSKTRSLWRIYLPATDDAEEACSGNISVTSENLKDLDLSARTACIYRIDKDGEGTLIYSKEADERRAQASTTKLMTAVLLVESGLIDSKTEISSHAANTPWGSGRLAAGDVYKTRDLLYAMLLPSSNDAATAVAERVGGSESRFVKMMNAKAKKLGFTDTHFCNPHGLDADGHYTTAAELAKLTAYAYTFPEIRECWATSYKTIKSLEYGRKWTLWSTNAIFGYISNFLGGKTGTEDNAGCCFTGVYTYEGSDYVTVVLGSGYGFSRWSDTKKLHQYIRDYAATAY